MELELQLLVLVKVVEDDKSVADLTLFKLFEVDGLVREGGLLSFVANVSSAHGEISEEGHLWWLLVLVL